MTATDTFPANLHFAIDSRSVVDSANTIFVALTTSSGDGHRYIGQLYERGVRHFVVSKAQNVDSMPDARFYVVKSPLEALQSAALKRRDDWKNTVVVGITGSRGKTAVKERLSQIIGEVADVERSPRSWNSQIGVPLSILSMTDNPEIAVVEAGVSSPGDMKPLARIIRPTIGIIVNVTDEHSEAFADRREQINEKLDLFEQSDTIIFDGSDTQLAEAVRSRYADRELRPFDGSMDVDTVDRAIICLVADRLGLTVDTESLPPLPVTRLDVIEGVNNCKLIFDRFTPDIASLETSLDFLHRRAPVSHSRTLIIATDAVGDDNGFTALRHLVSLYNLGRVITVGRRPVDFGNIAADNYQTVEALTDALTANDFSDETILIRGNGEADLWPLYAMLEAKQHETVLEVNLDAVVDNLNLFRSYLRPTTGVICMLKAAGYGAGSVELARTLQAHGAAYIAVAVVDEGVELRQAGITMPIMVLNPRAQNMKMMFDHRLEPEIYSLEMLEQIIEAAGRYGVTDFPVHIKLETGMSRLGFLPEQIEALATRLLSTDTVRAATVFSHLSCADDPTDDDYTYGQFEQFEQMCDRLDSLLPQHPRRHILNSTGIIRFGERQYDYVRLGIGLYGIPTLPGDPRMASLREVSSLTSVIISLKNWETGRSIGYNRRTRLSRDSVIATIPVGYADGLDRHLGNSRGSVWIKGHLAPIVGNVCMDIIMVDVTDIVDAGIDVRVGDRVELFGSHRSAVEVAKTLDTIPYEILTSVSPRVKRVYYRE